MSKSKRQIKTKLKLALKFYIVDHSMLSKYDCKRFHLSMLSISKLPMLSKSWAPGTFCSRWNMIGFAGLMAGIAFIPSFISELGRVHSSWPCWFLQDTVAACLPARLRLQPQAEASAVPAADAAPAASAVPAQPRPPALHPRLSLRPWRWKGCDGVGLDKRSC